MPNGKVNKKAKDYHNNLLKVLTGTERRKNRIVQYMVVKNFLKWKEDAAK